MRKEKAVCLTRREARIMTLLAVAALLISYRSHSGTAPGLRYGLLGLVQHIFCKSFEYTTRLIFHTVVASLEEGLRARPRLKRVKYLKVGFT